MFSIRGVSIVEAVMISSDYADLAIFMERQRFRFGPVVDYSLELCR